MNFVHDLFKHNQARKNVIVGGAVILVCITLLSCVSSFMIYKEGFTDMPSWLQSLLAMFAVVVVEGTFVWLVYGFTRVFSSSLERIISFVGMAFLVLTMLVNIITHFMIVKNYQLNSFQQGWLAWGAVSVFIVVLLVVLAITIADPVVRLIRLELRFQGRKQESIIAAKSEGLEGKIVGDALTELTNSETQHLADEIRLGIKPRSLPTEDWEFPKKI